MEGWVDEGLATKVAAELSFLFSIFDEWLGGQTPFQAEGERGDVQNVQEAKNQINHPSEMPDQF